jgi:DNA-binding NarL/FixJ family response regulator
VIVSGRRRHAWKAPRLEGSARVVLAEDGALLREGLAGLLERFGYEVMATVEDADTLIAVVDEQTPDVVITDVRMPPTYTDEGLRAAIRLRSRHPGLAVLALSQYVEQTYAAELLEPGGGAGAGYLLKDRIGDVMEFLEALRRVRAGEIVIDPEILRQLFRNQTDPVRRLTSREYEVLTLMAEGRSNAAIARNLTITEAAVSKHIAGILAKLDLPPNVDQNRRVMAILAYFRGTP